MNTASDAGLTGFIAAVIDGIGFLDILATGFGALALVAVVVSGRVLHQRLQRLEREVQGLRRQRAEPRLVAANSTVADRSPAAAAQDGVSLALSARAKAAGRLAVATEPARAAVADSSAAANSTVYQQACQLLQRGVAPADVAAACGISRTEVDLAARLVSPAAQVA